MSKRTPDDSIPLPVHPHIHRALVDPKVPNETKTQILEGIKRIKERELAEQAVKPAPDPFASSKYCINRAKIHIATFKERIAEYAKEQTHVRRSEFDLKTLETVYYFTSIKPLPSELGGLLFDASNNLRAALDQAIFSVTGRKLVAAYPIVLKYKSLKDGINGRCAGAPQEIKRIVRRTKPYKGGNDLLWGLHVLCNTNKHEIVSPTMILAGRAMVNDVVVRPDAFTDSTENKIEVLRLPFGEKLKTPNKMTLTTRIVIGGINFINTQPAVTILDQFVDMVEGIVMSIEAEMIRLGKI